MSVLKSINPNNLAAFCDGRGVWCYERAYPKNRTKSTSKTKPPPPPQKTARLFGLISFPFGFWDEGVNFFNCCRHLFVGI